LQLTDIIYIIKSKGRKDEEKVENSKTLTNIRLLDKDEEIYEISRLLGGEDITDAIITTAKEMKGLADMKKLYWL